MIILFPKRIYSISELALIADGVKPEDVYKVLGTEAGYDRALSKLDSIRKDIVWWTANAQQAQLLADGETDYQLINNSRWYHARFNEKKNFVPMWHAQIYSYDMWVIPKGSPRLKEAKQFLAFMLKAENMAEFTHALSYPPARKSALNFVRADMKPWLATSHFEDSLFQDGVFWSDRLDSYTKKFETWLQK